MHHHLDSDLSHDDSSLLGDERFDELFDLKCRSAVLLFIASCLKLALPKTHGEEKSSLLYNPGVSTRLRFLNCGPLISILSVCLEIVAELGQRAIPGLDV